MIRALLVLLLIGAAPLAPAATQEASGQFASGAYWRAVAPEGWEPGDGLVVWNHGFDLKPPGPLPDLGVLAELQLSQGYAVAATSYSQTGWALFTTLRDQRDLVARFTDHFGKPERIYLTGGSLGGLVSVQGAEAAGLDNVAGVYSICGALGGSRLWDAALDLRLAYDSVCADVSGASIRGGAKGLPDRLPPERYTSDNLISVLSFAFRDRVNACTGVFDSPEKRSQGQQDRLDRLMGLLDIPNEDFFLINMGYATFGLADLVHDPAKLDGNPGSGNARVNYGDAGLNSAIERYRAAPRHRLRQLASYQPTGELGESRMVAIHTSSDGLVPVESLSAYRDKAAPERLATGVVEEINPSHCGFSRAEVVAGWSLLTGWVERDAGQPDAAAMQAECLSLAGSGADGPCRYAPDFSVGSLDGKVRPRREPAVPITRELSGAWYDPSRSGEGWVIEVLDDERALVYWFTYPPAGAPGRQQWLIGVGEIGDRSLTVELLDPISGRPFNGAQGEVELRDWGTARFTFSGPHAGMMRWAGPEGYSAGQHPIIRLAGPPVDADAATPGPGISGSWFDDDWEGEGWHLMRLGEKRVLVYWFTFDGRGRPAWLVGVGELTDDGTVVVDAAETAFPGGAAFGHEFDPAAVRQPPWGRLEFRFDGDGCESGRMTFDSHLPAFGAGERDLTTRLTVLSGACAP